jgi:hypothetical protein
MTARRSQAPEVSSLMAEVTIWGLKGQGIMQRRGIQIAESKGVDQKASPKPKKQMSKIIRRFTSSAQYVVISLKTRMSKNRRGQTRIGNQPDLVRPERGDSTGPLLFSDR